MAQTSIKHNPTVQKIMKGVTYDVQKVCIRKPLYRVNVSK